MIRPVILAAAAMLFAASPVVAQSTTQTDLQKRHDRALAAGYKAMMLCSAISNAELFGASRTPQSVLEWELAGIDATFNAIIDDLPFEIVRAEAGHILYVLVDWADDMPPRIARHDSSYGCVNLPIGWDVGKLSVELSVPPRPQCNGAPSTPEASPPRSHPTLMALATSALDNQTYGAGSRTTAILVQRNGVAAIETYADGFGPRTPQRTWSVAKSIAATLIGAEVAQGRAGLEQSIPLPAIVGAGDPRHKVTIDHLLRMASGRYSDAPGNRSDALYWGGSSVGETVFAWPLVYAPGTVFRYANNDTLAATAAIVPKRLAAAPPSFFAQIGMDNTIAETDWQGDFILSSQVWSTARDLAHLGQLYLDNGVAPDAVRVLPENWLEYVSTPSGPQPEGELGYGAGWWLINKSQGIPVDTIAAIGNRGQFLVVVPSRDVVIVRRGEDPFGSRFDVVAFTRDVLRLLD